MRLTRSATPFIIGLTLLFGVASGCTSVKKFARHPFGDRIKDRENRYNFAQVMERNGDHQRAERNYRTLSEEAPHDARYYQRLGVVLVRQGKLNDGIAMLNKAHELDKDNLAILNDLGYAYTIDGQFFDAESVLREAMKIDSRDVRTQNNLAMVLGYMGKTDDAYEMFRRNTDEGTARNNIAYIHAQSGNVNLAVKEYSKALSHSPGNKPAAEALVQLNTLNRSLAATKAEESNVQLASNQKAEPAATRPVAHESEEVHERSDLVQLLNKVEEPDDHPANEVLLVPPEPAATQPVRVEKNDYDWSSVP